MTFLIQKHTNILEYASFAAGVACGTAVGYTLSASGDLLNNALIVGSCGISRAAQTLFFDRPLFIQTLVKQNELIFEQCEQAASERDDFLTQSKISKVFYKANLGFGLGTAFGTGGATASLLSGGLIHAIGFFAEQLPVIFLGNTDVEFNENNGRLIT